MENSARNQVKRLRHTIDSIRQDFQRNEYILLSKEYINNKQKLNYICPVGHEYNITYNNWCSGYRCFTCSIEKKAIAKREDISDVNLIFENEGYKLLSKRYINSKQKLSYLCPSGHLGSISFEKWKHNGQRCAICSHKRGSKLQRHDINIVKELFNSEEYQVLSDNYENNNTRIKFKCPNGHIGYIRYGDFQQGHRCFECHIDRLRKYSDDELHNLHIYKLVVRRITNNNFKKYYSFINPNNFKRGKSYHVDHVYSIIDGFDNNILPVVIANPMNLRVIPARENILKKRKSLVSVDILFEKYCKFKEVYYDM
uniref:Uncharacterized protein n=1 Tax=viral metagenome TaxID=1070528 RepID=A0A6M3J7N3_9ZZZZ